MYYSLQLVTAGERADAEARMELYMDETTQPIGTQETDEQSSDTGVEVGIWERAVLPALEWMICGQRPMGLERDLEDLTASRRTVPLTKFRDECHTFLNKTFGLATDDNG